MTFSESVERYLSTGEHDLAESEVDDRPGTDSEASLRRVLGRVLTYRARRAPLRKRALPENGQAIVADRVGSMVRGLLGDDAPAALRALPSRVVILDAQQFDALTHDVPLPDAWALANLVLDDLGAPPLADDVPALDGLITAGRAWVPVGALGPPGPFTDILAHEVAHLLHELTRADVGLSQGTTPLVQVAVAHRETYAYACEVWACIERAAPPGPGRGRLVQEYCAEHGPADHRVNIARLRSALALAADDPHGAWDRICAVRSPRAAAS